MDPTLHIPTYETLCPGRLYAKAVPTSSRETKAGIEILELARWRALTAHEGVSLIEQKAANALHHDAACERHATEFWLSMLGDRLLSRIATGGYRAQLVQTARAVRQPEYAMCEVHCLRLAVRHVDDQLFKQVCQVAEPGCRAQPLYDAVYDRNLTAHCMALRWANLPIDCRASLPAFNPVSVYRLSKAGSWASAQSEDRMVLRSRQEHLFAAIGDEGWWSIGRDETNDFAEGYLAEIVRQTLVEPLVDRLSGRAHSGRRSHR